MSRRVTAYAMLVHHALNELYTSEDGCCTECCAPCHALKTLDEERVLDPIVREWREYSDGTKVDLEKIEWWKDGKVDRSWMYHQWSIGEVSCSHHDPEET